MSAPRTPADVRGTWDALGADIARRQSLLADCRSGGVDVPDEVIAEHAITLLAQGGYLARMVDAFVAEWGLTAVLAGAPFGEVADAAGLDVAALRARLLSFVDQLERVHQHPSMTYGMDPVAAEQVRALITGGDR